jgi:hypothetical protein
MADDTPTSTPAPAGDGSASSPGPVGDSGGSAPDTGSGDSGSTADEGGGETALTQANDITPDTFDWDGWDGSSYDPFPEHVRAWAPRLQERFTREAQAQRQEAERARQVYEALVEGHEDPRLAELRQQYEAASTEHRTWREKHDAQAREFEQYRQQVEQHFQEQSRAAVDAYKAKHSWMFDNGPIQQLGGVLLDEGFGQDDLPVILRLPDPVQKRAREINADLVKRGAKDAGTYAIKLARSEVKLPGPTTSANLVAGSDPATSRTSTTTPNTAVEGGTLHELTQASLRRNLQRLGRA